MNTRTEFSVLRVMQIDRAMRGQCKTGRSLRAPGATQVISRASAARALRFARSCGHSTAYSIDNGITRVETPSDWWHLEPTPQVTLHRPRVLHAVLAAMGTGVVSVLFAAQLVYGWSV